MTINRRSLVIGASCIVAAGAAAALKPRRHVSLLGSEDLKKVVPGAFGGWTSRAVSDLVAPKTEGSLSARLYNQTVERVYHNAQTGVSVMALIAHGDTQSDSLQLHRPEICYPAFGFAITQNRPIRLALAQDARLPARQLQAKAPGRVETIVYWSRLGDFLPIDGGEQRVDRLRTAMSGYIADGLLARFSVLGGDTKAAASALKAFVPQLLAATAPEQRKVLIGRRLAASLAA